MEKVPLTQIQNLSFKSKTIPKCKVILGAICIHEYHIVVFDYFMSQTVQLPKKNNLTLFRFDIEQTQKFPVWVFATVMKQLEEEHWISSLGL